MKVKLNKLLKLESKVLIKDVENYMSLLILKKGLLVKGLDVIQMAILWEVFIINRGIDKFSKWKIYDK